MANVLKVRNNEQEWTTILSMQGPRGERGPQGEKGDKGDPGESSTITPETIIDLIYPVGSIYMSVNDVSPQTFLGGSWERLQNKFLIGAGDGYAINEEGGTTSHTHTSAAHTHTIAGHTHTSAAHTHTTGNHTLTVAEIPSHTHSISSSGAHTHKFTGYLHTYGISSDTYKAVSHIRYPGDGSNVPPSMDSSGGHTHSPANTGGGGAHTHGDTGSTTPGATGSTSLTSDSTTPNNTGSSSNLPPYLAVYMWKRTA